MTSQPQSRAMRNDTKKVTMTINRLTGSNMSGIAICRAKQQFNTLLLFSPNVRSLKNTSCQVAHQTCNVAHHK